MTFLYLWPYCTPVFGIVEASGQGVQRPRSHFSFQKAMGKGASKRQNYRTNNQACNLKPSLRSTIDSPSSYLAELFAVCTQYHHVFCDVLIWVLCVEALAFSCLLFHLEQLFGIKFLIPAFHFFHQAELISKSWIGQEVQFPSFDYTEVSEISSYVFKYKKLSQTDKIAVTEINLN